MTTELCLNCPVVRQSSAQTNEEQNRAGQLRRLRATLHVTEKNQTLLGFKLLPILLLLLIRSLKISQSIAARQHRSRPSSSLLLSPSLRRLLVLMFLRFSLPHSSLFHRSIARSLSLCENLRTDEPSHIVAMNQQKDNDFPKFSCCLETSLVLLFIVVRFAQQQRFAAPSTDEVIRRRPKRDWNDVCDVWTRIWFDKKNHIKKRPKTLASKKQNRSEVSTRELLKKINVFACTMSEFQVSYETFLKPHTRQSMQRVSMPPRTRHIEILPKISSATRLLSRGSVSFVKVCKSFRAFVVHFEAYNWARLRSPSNFRC